MFNSIFTLLKPKKKPEDKSDDIPGFIPAFDDIQDFKSQHNLTCPARTTCELIRYLESRPNQKWYVFKSARKKAHPINVGVYEEFPALDEALEWLETYGGGKYFVKPLSLGKCKLGYYEFKGEDKEPEGEEDSIRTKRLRLKYKPKDFKEALLLQRLEEGDEQLIQKITDAELSRQGIVRNECETYVPQPQGVDLKDHFDKVEELKEEIHKRDMQIIEERFRKGEKGNGWDVFTRMMESDTGKELGKEALETVREIFRKDPGGIHLVIGKQRGGKTALCFFLAQATGREPIYAITAAFLVLPGVEMIEDIMNIPRGGVCVVDDAQLFFNSKKLEAPRGRIHYKFVWSGTLSID